MTVDTKPFATFNSLWDKCYPEPCKQSYEECKQFVLNGDSELYDEWHNQYHISKSDFLYGLKWVCYDLRQYSPTGIQTALAVEYDKFTDTYKMRPLTYDTNEFGVTVYTNATNNITRYNVNDPKVVALIHYPSEVEFKDDSLPF